ncbi:hypothetical protein AV530_000466 [Patagioenas fasciata monilis]|uniref:Uncharacterized protein n=1 Tax=Patagioenas fasciata monilis TaxID=372326 RepID=A0A1V4JZ91_PATFA|nr:hypothetical protein AV530_000466 [Patagioenas fasciata monilis]
MGSALKPPLNWKRCQLSRCYRCPRRTGAETHNYRHQQDATDHPYREGRKPIIRTYGATFHSSRGHFYEQARKSTTQLCDITHHCSKDNAYKQPTIRPSNVTYGSSRDHLYKQARKSSTQPLNIITPPVSAGGIFNQL